MAGRRTALSIATVAALVAGAGALSLLPGAAPPAAASGLVPYGSCEELLAHHRERLRAAATPWGFDGGGWASFGGASTDVAVAATGGGVAGAGAGAAAAEAAPVARGATGTNLQEQGVDEPDTAKLRDGRLVVLGGGRLSVVTASATPTVVSSLSLGDQAWGGELLLSGDRAVVVLSGWRETPQPASPSGARLALVAPGVPTTRLVLVDLADPERPEVLERAEHDGQYLSARLVDGTLRLVTSSAPQPPTAHASGPEGEAAARRANVAAADALTVEQVVPQVRRTDADGRVLQDGAAVECGRVAHTQDGAGSSTLLVSTVRPDEGLGSLDSTGVTAHGDLVYASTDRLYVGTSRWGTTQPVPVDDTPGAVQRRDPDAVETELHAFDTTHPRRTTYVASGAVPGYVYGRWALSEHEGALRVATTRQPPWEQGAETSSSLAVLAERDGALVETGRVDGLGRTEHIKAVRYSGDTAAVVTFRQTDPLYLLDLSDPTAPRVTGELKVPGFSTYLHPLGDGLLLGVGQDATDQGRVTGMQLSTFDVSDPAAPRQVDRLSLGEGWSPALDDSRAFGYDPSRRLATLPFSTWDERGGSAAALGVHVGEDGALSEVGRLEVHPTTPTERVLLHEDVILSVSSRGVAAGDAATFRRTGAVALPQDAPQGGGVVGIPVPVD